MTTTPINVTESGDTSGRSIPDDPIAAVAGKYAWIEKSSDDMRDEDRAFEADRDDS